MMSNFYQVRIPGMMLDNFYKKAIRKDNLLLQANYSDLENKAVALILKDGGSEMKEEKGIIIEMEKTFLRGEKAFKVTRVKALRWEDLPEEYVEGGLPFVYQKTDHQLMVCGKLTPDVSSFTIDVGCVYRKEGPEKWLPIIARCGERLKEINDRIRKEEKGWHGKVKVVF